jgi:very-short-patch-repair endonuclease
MTAAAAFINGYLETHQLRSGTHPENLAAFRLHRGGHKFEHQYRVGRYRLDFAWPKIKVGLEIDGPHHLRPDVAVKDAFRDCELQNEGWLIFRVHYTDSFEEQLARISGLIHRELQGSGGDRRVAA